MAATFYRLLACVLLPALVAGCGRASYSFNNQAAPALVVAPAAATLSGSASSLAVPLALATVATAEPRRRHRRQQQTKRRQQAASLVVQLPARPPLASRVVARLAARHSAEAASGALLPDNFASGLAVLGLLLVLLFGALIAVVAYAISRVAQHNANRPAQQGTVPATPAGP